MRYAQHPKAVCCHRINGRLHPEQLVFGRATQARDWLGSSLSGHDHFLAFLPYLGDGQQVRSKAIGSDKGTWHCGRSHEYAFS